MGQDVYCFVSGLQSKTHPIRVLKAEMDRGRRRDRLLVERRAVEAQPVTAPINLNHDEMTTVSKPGAASGTDVSCLSANPSKTTSAGCREALRIPP